MPLPALGLLGMLANVGRAGSMGYRAFKTARAAQPAAKQLFKMEGSGLQKGLSALAKGERKLIRKTPATAGGLELALSAPYAAEGVTDVAKGMYEGDYGQVASGLGSLALTAPFVGRGLRIAGQSKKLPASIRNPLYQTGKETMKKVPMKKTFAPGLALSGVGAFTERGDTVANAEEQVLGEPVTFTVRDVLQSVEADKQNIGKPTVIDGQEVIIGSQDYKKIAQEKLDEAYKNEQAQGSTPVATVDQISQVFTFDPSVTGGANVTNEGALPKVSKETDLNEGEIQFLANKQEKDAEKGAIIKKKMAKSKEADEFNAFYDRITNLTGGNDQTSNLLLMKFATGLMSGKTAKSGVRGFLDVAGQSGSGVADTALALFSKEQDRRKDLAVAYLKAKEKQKPAGIQADKERRTVVVRDPSLPFGARTVQVGTDKKTGLDVMFVPTPDGSGTQAVPMKYTEYTPVKVSTARLDKMRKQLSSIEQGYKFTQVVDSLPKEAFGLTAKGKLGYEKVTGAIGDAFELMGIGDVGSASSNADAEIVDLITSDKIDDAGNIVASTEAERKETEKVVNQYRKEVRSIMDGAKTSDGELDNITRARLIEVRMKYILANANKTEDRLTRADVQDAEQATKIMGLFTGEKEVRSSYRNLAKDLEAQFLRLSKNYVEAGGNEEFLLSFEQMPYIRKIYADRANNDLRKNIAQNQEQIIGTIE